MIAIAFGVHAVHLIGSVDRIGQGDVDRMVSWPKRQLVDMPIEEAIARYASIELDGPLIVTARGFGICLSD